MPTVVFDETHNERVVLRTWSHLRDLLQDHNFTVDQYSDFPIVADKIKKADLFIFGCPDGSKLYEYEIATLIKYVEDGGSLLILGHSGGDRGLMSNMNLLLEKFDIELMSNQVIDNVDCWENSYPTHVLIKNFGNHPAVEGINVFCFISGCGLVVDSPAKGVAFSGYHAETPNKPVIAIRTYGSGKICVIGCHRSFSGYRAGISLFDNSNLFLQIVRWLVEKEAYVDSPPSFSRIDVETSLSTSKTVEPSIIEPGSDINSSQTIDNDSQTSQTDQVPVRRIQAKTSKIKRISTTKPSVVKVTSETFSEESRSLPPSAPSQSSSSEFDLSSLELTLRNLGSVVNEIKSDLNSFKSQTNQKMDEIMKEIKVLSSMLRLKDL